MSIYALVKPRKRSLRQFPLKAFSSSLLQVRASDVKAAYLLLKLIFTVS